MFNLPTFREITSTPDRYHFAKTYSKCSGLPVPDEFILATTNQIFGLYIKGNLIGGFILGQGPAFRTISVFASESHQEALYHQFITEEECTEICCFFISRAYRQKTLTNFSSWAAMIYAQIKYGRKTFLFGTCSRSLAKLYGQTEKSMLIHEDKINGKSTFIFCAERRFCVQGMLKIMYHKLQRTIKVAKRGAKRFSPS